MGSTFGSNIDQNNIESEMQPTCVTRYFSAKFRRSWAEKFDFNANRTSGHAGWPCQTHIAVSTVLVRLFHAWWHIHKIEKSVTTYAHKCPVCFLSLLTHRTLCFRNMRNGWFVCDVQSAASHNTKRNLFSYSWNGDSVYYLWFLSKGITIPDITLQNKICREIPLQRAWFYFLIFLS